MSSDNSVSQWTKFMTEIMDRLTGKGAIVEYNFEDLTIDVPKSLSPEGKQLGSKWTINGKVTIKAETHSNK